jgi:hypothetical protein
MSLDSQHHFLMRKIDSVGIARFRKLEKNLVPAFALKKLDQLAASPNFS